EPRIALELLQLRGELVEQIGVRARVDLALEQLRGRIDGQLRHVAPQALAHASRLELDLMLRGRDESLAFGRGRALRLLDHLVRAALRLIDDLARAVARLAQYGLATLLGLDELGLTLLGRGETHRDLARAILHRAHDVGPHPSHNDPDE